MSRRAGLPILLFALGLAAGVLVARVPPDLERSVVTRRHHNADPLLTAVLLRFDVESLLTSPARYFQPPFLYPDPNPQRGTEPLVAEALLAVPFRLALGDDCPALVFTLVRILTLALVVLATGLMLRELGVRDSLALMGGGLAVLIAPTAVFFDRLQAVSVQWLPLGILFAARFWRSGRRLDMAAFVACVFLTVQASLYTTVMVAAVAPFLAPVAWSARAARDAARRGAALALGVLAAGALCLLVLWPWLQHRGDVAVHARPALLAEKSWGPAHLADPFTSPPEWPLGPGADWDGVFPGFGFVLAALAAGALSLGDRARGRAGVSGTPAFIVSGRILASSLALLLAIVSATAWFGATGATRAAADVLLWMALAAWCTRLVLWTPPWEEDSSRLRLLASAASLAALLWFLFSLGSPVRWTPFAEPLLEGLFGPVARVLGPLRELRELKRFLLPAGWAMVVALVLVLERRLHGRPRALAPVLAAVVLAVALGERIQADTRKANVPSPPAAYTLLDESTGTGGLLELPFDDWGRIRSIHRMLWQPSHGRPIVAGKTGIDPGWYTPARDVFNEFPSEESLLLMRAWGLDTVLERRRGPRPPETLESLPAGLDWRGRQDDARGEWNLFDLFPGPSVGTEPSPGPGRWRRLAPVSPADEPAIRATDGSLDTAAEVTEDGVTLVLPEKGEVVAVELDYGAGRFNRVPPLLRVLGLVSGEWRDLVGGEDGERLRARAAVQLLRDQRARLVIPLARGPARRLLLVSGAAPWDLPEVRARVVEPW